MRLKQGADSNTAPSPQAVAAQPRLVPISRIARDAFLGALIGFSRSPYRDY